MLKWLIGIVLVLVVLGGAGGVVAMQSGALERFRGGGEDKDVEVIVEAAELGKLTRTVSAPGSVAPRALVQISSQVSAEVLALPFREGDLVRRGDVVVRLDPQDLEARLNSAQAQLRAEEARLICSEASLINARLEYQRWERLLETGDATATEVEAAEARYKQAESNKLALEAGIEQARAGIDQVDEDIANTVIESPMDGIITVLNAEVGETVIVGTTNNAGSVIMEIADLGEMILEAQIDETNIAPVREGQPATVYINAYPDREYRGNVRRIGLKRQVSASGTGIFEVEILLEEISEDDRLYSGMTASTDIAVEEFFDVVVGPSQAVLEKRVDELPEEVKDASEHWDRDKTFARIVYRFVEGKAIATPVTVGPSDLTSTVITGGVSEGDRIITGPFSELRNLAHDAAVTERDAEDADDAADGADAAGAVEADAESDSQTGGEADTDAEIESGEPVGDEA